MTRVAAVSRVAPCVQPTDVRLLEEAGLQSRNREILARETVRLARADVEQSDVLTEALPGDLGAEVDLLRGVGGAQSDSATEERQDAIGVALALVVFLFVGAGEVEERGAVEEEVTPLGEEQGKARQVHLALIDLGLGEVGIDREVRPKERRGVVEEVDPRTGVDIRASVAPAG